jgi:hypothetical protein
MDEDTEETLPQTQSDLAPVNMSFDELDDTADTPTVRKADIKIFNMQLQTLSTAYKHVRSIGGLLALNKEVREMIKARRDILGLEYGAPANKTPRTIMYEPLP